MLKKNDVITATVETLTADGFGVARHEGEVVFVPFSTVGDELRLLIVKAASSHAFGKILEITRPGQGRVEPECPYFSRCGGCAFWHISYESELAAKRQTVCDALERLGGISVPVAETLSAGATAGYRNKAQFPVSGRAGSLETGFFAQRSHRVIPVESCLLQPRQINETLAVCRELLNSLGVAPYDEEKRRGVLRHILIRRSESSGEVMVCLVVNADALPWGHKFADALRGRLPFVTSVMQNTNKKPGNVILAEWFETLSGKAYIEDELCGVPVKLSAPSFYQINREAAKLLYREAARAADIKENETLLDLYCGAGTIGLSMAKHCKRLIGVEIVPEAIEDARANAKNMGADNVEFLLADAGEAASELAQRRERPDVIVADPPRKGCDEKTLEAMAAMEPGRIVMVSCNPATLARDLKRLGELGYEVKYAVPVDMFPRTAHVECVTLLTKNKE